MDLMSFGFMTQTVSENTVNMVGGDINFAMRCYNLFLLYFYFEIMKYVIKCVQFAMRKMSRFDRG